MNLVEAYKESRQQVGRLEAALAQADGVNLHLKALCARAADALDGYGTKPWHQYRELLEELREAAK